MPERQPEFDWLEEAMRAGLGNLNAAELAQFARANLAIRRMIAQLPRDLLPELEPATQFRPPPPE